MAEQKTKPTPVKVEDFIEKIEDKKKRDDSYEILKMLKDITNEKPRMWGPTMIGFGECHYKYESGHEGDCFQMGFSPRKQAFSLYLTCNDIEEEYKDHLKKLGKYKTGKCCLYIKRLSDIDIKILKEMFEMSWKSKV